MEQLYLIFLFLFFCTVLLYVSFIALFCFGWVYTNGNVEIVDELSTKITIIVAARNEERCITSCLRALVNQSYPTSNMKIIVVDDASEDDTCKNIQLFCEQYSFVKLISLNGINKETGKKAAIQKAIEQSTGELIVTTDADCVMGMDWLRLLISFYQKTKAPLIAGPVCFHQEKNVFQKMQSLEFMSLIASGAGAMYFNKAILCNGANLMYTREAFLSVNGFKGVDEVASGDDVLLMYKIKKQLDGKIKFLKHVDAIVYTQAKVTLHEFIQQRKRWASKKFSHLNLETQLVSITVYLLNLFLLVSPLVIVCMCTVSDCSFQLWKIWLLILGIKSIIDFLLLFLTASFFKKRQLLRYFIVEQMLYIPYVVWTGIAGRMGKYVWKGRKI